MRIPDFLRDNAAFLSAGFLLSFGSAFAGGIRTEFELSHAAWGQIYSVGTILSAIVMVWSGALTDQFRIRVLGVIVIGGLALSCLFMASVTSIPMLVAAIFFLRLAGQGMMNHLSVVAMARWFVATRGRALSVAQLGVALAEATLPILVVLLLTLYDWRFIWVGAGLAVIFALPVLIRLLRLERTPQSIAASTQSDGMDGKSWRRAEVLRHHLFWLIIPVLMGPAAFGTAFFFQQVHIAEVKGFSHLALVSLFPVYTVTAICSMFLSGFLIDRIGTARLMPVFQLPMIGAFLLYSYAQSPWAMMAGMVLMGMTTGSNSTIPTAFWAEFYGTRYLGSVKAMATAVMVLGSALGPGVTGSLITAGIGIETQMIGIAAYFLIACAMTGFGVASVRTRLPAAA